MTLTLRLPLLLPGESLPNPLPMPDQDLRAPFTDPAAPGIHSRLSTRAIRTLVLALPAGLAGLLGWSSFGWFALNGRPDAVEALIVGVTVFAFYWVALSFCSALLGLLWRPARAAAPTGNIDIAILLPMYGEPAAATIGTATDLLAALAVAGRHRISLHVLSDTRDPGAAFVEEAVILVQGRTRPELAIRYRRRAENTDFKSGNIRDWVTTEGAAYEAILILDADSVMDPKTVLRMADLMAAEPGLGLVQSPPRVLPGATLWQRLQSFAAEVYGLNLSRGFTLWAGDEANFLGHNALLRTRAFAASAGLPHLSGRAPRGGVILSHDFVEAALMRRAGWGVRMLPEAGGSYEATPETLLGYLRRDRRWCQGNMQHLRLLATPGLHPVSRFHLLQGAMGYLASVWWMMLLLLWAFTGPGGAMHDFFSGNPLMPNWPQYPALSQASLVALVFLMLLGPKVLGVVAHICDRGLSPSRAPGFALSIITEIVLSILIAPALMLHQVRAVLRTLAGFDGGWIPHAADRPSLPILLQFHAIESVLGLGLIALAATGLLTLWLVPVALSLVLTVPLSWLVQRECRPEWLLRPLLECAS